MNVLGFQSTLIVRHQLKPRTRAESITVKVSRILQIVVVPLNRSTSAKLQQSLWFISIQVGFAVRKTRETVDNRPIPGRLLQRESFQDAKGVSTKKKQLLIDTRFNCMHAA